MTRKHDFKNYISERKGRARVSLRSNDPRHKIIKRSKGIVIDNLANYLSISPNQTKISPSVCLVLEF